MIDFTALMATAQNQGWALVALDCAVDTTTPAGEAMAHLLATFAQFERRLIQERTRAGLAAARARGKQGGRKPRCAAEPRVCMAYTLYVDQRLTVPDICQTVQISPATFYRYVALGKRAANGL